MKIMVTGGAGFIGSHVVDRFVEAGHEVVIVDDLSSGREGNLNSQAKFIRMDLRDPDLARVFEAERPEIVDHHAAQMDVRKSVLDPIFDADVNVRGGLNLLECARRYGSRKIVYASTGGAVYGEPEYLPCDEDHPIHPICPYGASKHIIEDYLFMYRALYGLEYTVLRYPNVYGPRQDPYGEAGVVAIFTGRMLRGQPVTINGSGEQERDFVFVGDCARANITAAEDGRRGIFNLGWGHGTNIIQIFRELKTITAYPDEPNYGPPKPGETFKIYLDASRAREQLGWEPAVSLRDGLTQTVDYFRLSEGDSAPRSPRI